MTTSKKQSKPVRPVSPVSPAKPVKPVNPVSRAIRRRSGNPAARKADPTVEARAARAEQRAVWAIWLFPMAVLVWVPGGFSRFVVAKLLVTVIAIGLAATVPARARLHPWVTRLFCVGIGLFVLAAVLGSTPMASLVGRWPRYEGLPMLIAYAGCAWAGARLLDNQRRVGTLVTAIAATSCLLGVFSALDRIGWSPLGASDVARTGSLLGNATDQGLIGMICVAILFRPAIETRRELYLFGLAGAATTVVVSGSRFALLATVAVLVWAAVRRRALLPAVAGGVAVLVAAVLVVPAARERLLNGHTVRGRLLTWDLSSDMATDKWLLGWGPSRYVDTVGRYENQTWADWVGSRTALDSPHNWLLQVQLAGGVPLLLCALGLVGLTVWLAVRTIRDRPELTGVFAAVAGYGAVMLANFTNPTSTCLAAFLAGSLVAVPARSVVEVRAKQADPVVEVRAKRASKPLDLYAWRDRLIVGVAGIAAAMLLVLAVSEVMLQHGFEQAGDGETAAAIETLDQAVSLRPADPDADMLAAQMLAALTSRGELEAAGATIEHARASLERTPETYESRITLGVALLAQEKIDEAFAVLDGAVRDFPMRPAGYVQRGIAHLGLGDVEAARADLRRAIALGDRTARDVLSRMPRQAPPTD